MTDWQKLEKITQILEKIKQEERDIDNIENDNYRIEKRQNFDVKDKLEQIKDVITS